MLIRALAIFAFVAVASGQYDKSYYQFSSRCPECRRFIDLEEELDRQIDNIKVHIRKLIGEAIGEDLTVPKLNRILKTMIKDTKHGNLCPPSLSPASKTGRTWLAKHLRLENYEKMLEGQHRRAAKDLSAEMDGARAILSALQEERSVAHKARLAAERDGYERARQRQSGDPEFASLGTSGYGVAEPELREIAHLPVHHRQELNNRRPLLSLFMPRLPLVSENPHHHHPRMTAHPSMNVHDFGTVGDSLHHAVNPILDLLGGKPLGRINYLSQKRPTDPAARMVSRGKDVGTELHTESTPN